MPSKVILYYVPTNITFGGLRGVGMAGLGPFWAGLVPDFTIGKKRWISGLIKNWDHDFAKSIVG